MHLVPIGREHLRQAWPVIAPFAAQMAEAFPDDWPVPEIARAAEAGDLLLWVAWDEGEKVALAAVGTQIVVRASGRRFLEVALAAGHNHERWVHCITQLEDYGRRMGCQGTAIFGRTGWGASLRGYRMHRRAVFEKELSDGSAQAEPAAADGAADHHEHRPGAGALP